MNNNCLLSDSLENAASGGNFLSNFAAFLPIFASVITSTPSSGRMLLAPPPCIEYIELSPARGLCD